MPSDAACTWRGLSVRGIHACGLGPIDIDLSPGELVMLEGRSGSGKSRLLRAIVELDRHAGAASLDGRPRAGMAASAWRRAVALLPAESHWWLPTVAAHLESDGTAAIVAGLGLAGELLEAPVERLSTGERQRFALARLLSNRPRVLLLDEPTANLDPDSGARVETVIADYVAANDASVLWVSHDREQIRRLATGCLHMESGRIAEVDAGD